MPPVDSRYPGAPNLGQGLQGMASQLGRLLSGKPRDPRRPSLLGLQNSGAAPWEAPARAATRPAGAPPVDAGYVSPFRDKRAENLARIQADPNLGAWQPSAPAPAPAPAAPTIGAPAAQVTPAARAQDAEKLRMMQQYASDDYWKGETGKAMLELAQSQAAPDKNRLADFYEAQRAVGIGAKDEIIQGLTMGLKDDEAQRIAQWAEANPALAFREYNKRFPRGEATIGPTPGALQADEALKGVTRFFPGAELSSSAPAAGQALMAGTTQAQRETTPEPLGYGSFDDQEIAEVLPIAPRPVNPELARQTAMQALDQARPAQAVSTGATGGAAPMQPPSAAATEIGVEPAQAFQPANRENPADDLLRDHIDRARKRAALRSN